MVDNSVHRMGIGRCLTETAIEHALRHDFTAMKLLTSKYQISAVTLYERFGWRFKEAWRGNAPWWVDFNGGVWELDLEEYRRKRELKVVGA